MNAVVYFAHGRDTTPHGIKIRKLRRVAEAMGWAVEAPDYSDTKDVSVRTERLCALLEQDERRLVLVGSSMGAYVSAQAAQRFGPKRVEGLLLMAPAVHLPGYVVSERLTLPKHTVLVHGWSDEVVPAEGVIRFAREHDVELILTSDDHRLGRSHDLLEGRLATLLEDVF